MVSWYLSSTSSPPDSAAEAAAVQKRSKSDVVTLTHIFVPLAAEILGPVKAEGLRFLDQTGDWLSAVAGDPRSRLFISRTT